MDARSMTARIGDLVSFLSAVKGDLANVTAPASFLAPSSVVEVGHCWAQRPAVFAAPAIDPDPARRAMLVLRFMLSALKSQVYVAGEPGISIKKPLNAFLGELFLASWTDERSKTKVRLAAEQVSHHPPITAMHISSPGHGGVRADGYARVEMTFSGAVHIRQVGHAVMRLDAHDEDYLIPLPDVRVRGFLSGCLYPEILGIYHIVSSTGHVSEIKFSGAGVLRGKRNTFEARTFHKSNPKKTLFTTAGCWSESWTVKDAKGKTIETFHVDALENLPAFMEIDPFEEQDPWESRRAWSGVISGLKSGDSRAATAEKLKVEQAQRQMRAEEEERGQMWEPLLFGSIKGEEHEVFHRLTEGTDWELCDDRTKGVWRIRQDRLDGVQKPFRGDLTPLGIGRYE